MTVAATRTATDVFDTPSAVTVIDSATLRERLVNTPVDAFRDLPGLDVSGVGTNQTRLTIRGLGGQRILLTALVVAVDNLTNELYAEAANASFFRPEPRRSVSTSLVVELIMRAAVHYVPIVTTVISLAFAGVVLARWMDRRTPHLLWWGIGMHTYGAGTITESATTLLGWSEPVFRAWYIGGALLGGAPLAQGSVYLHLERRTANRLTLLVGVVVVAAAVFVLASPINYAVVEPFRLRDGYSSAAGFDCSARSSTSTRSYSWSAAPSSRPSATGGTARRTIDSWEMCISLWA